MFAKLELFAKQQKIKLHSKNKTICISHTLLKVIAPTTAGATKPGIDANVFVIPTSVPIQQTQHIHEEDLKKN